MNNTVTRHTQHPAAECELVRHVARVETPLITELVAALFHLERLAKAAGTPQEEVKAHDGKADPDQHRAWVLGNAVRIREALVAITAPYQLAEVGSVLTAETATSRASYDELRGMAEALVHAHAAGIETVENIADTGVELARIIPQLLDQLECLQAARTGETQPA